MNYTHQNRMTEIRNALGSDWTCKPIGDSFEDCGFYFIRNDGLTFFATIGGYKLQGKIQFSYSAPRDSKRNVPIVYENGEQIGSPKITCTNSKTAQKLAGDILRRLIPDCERVHALYIDGIASAEAYYIKEEKAKQVGRELKNGQGVYFRANGQSIGLSGYVSPEIAQKLSDFIATL